MTYSDLSFDELDKAVSSALAGKAGVPDDKPAPAVDAKHKVEVRLPIVSARRNGRLGAQLPGMRAGLIDVMAPKLNKTPDKSPSRFGATVQPDTSDTQLPDKPSENLNREPAEPVLSPADFMESVVEKTPQENPVIIGRPPQEEKWPDPLDFHEDIRTEPSSPFIQGAKVEKRPLGAFAGDVLEIAATDPSIPEELPKEVDNTNEVAAQPNESKLPELDVALTSPEPEQPPAHQQVQRIATLSIPQQYKTADKTPSSTSRPVFDTKEYHPPLLEATTPGGRHSSRPWLRFSVALLAAILLAASFYFAYSNFTQS